MNPRGEGNTSVTPKTIYDGEAQIAATNINPYLIDAPTALVESRGAPLQPDLPKMTKGCYPSDGGNLILSEDERAKLLAADPSLAVCVRRYVGAKDFINSDEVRYCLWLKDLAPSVYRHSKEIMRRLAAVREMRLKSTAAPTRKMAEKPYLFFSTPPLDGNYLALPEVSSERRDYIPIGFLTPDVIAANTMLVLPHATLYHFGVLTSSVHMAWMRVVAGRLEMRYRYSAAVVYNNFPWPDDFSAENGETERRGGADGTFSSEAVRRPLPLSASPSASSQTSKLRAKNTHDAITATAQSILSARALYPDSSLADLYDPLTMPPELRAAHVANDRAVLAAYGLSPGATEREIVAHLFRLYAEKVEKRKGGRMNLR